VVSLTAAGAKIVRAAEPHWRRAQQQVARRLGRERFDALIATLREMETLHPGARHDG
jgi:DNA-binding MarR family transcriptional regulator